MQKDKKGLLLSQAIEIMGDAIRNRDISDMHLCLEDVGHTTRKETFAGEYVYGITMVPCSFAIQLARKVLEKEGDQFIPYDDQSFKE